MEKTQSLEVEIMTTTGKTENSMTSKKILISTTTSRMRKIMILRKKKITEEILPTLTLISKGNSSRSLKNSKRESMLNMKDSQKDKKNSSRISKEENPLTQRTNTKEILPMNTPVMKLLLMRNTTLTP